MSVITLRNNNTDPIQYKFSANIPRTNNSRTQNHFSSQSDFRASTAQSSPSKKNTNGASKNLKLGDLTERKNYNSKNDVHYDNFSIPSTSDGITKVQSVPESSTSIYIKHFEDEIVNKREVLELDISVGVKSTIESRIDLKVIEPYKKVLSHGGYDVHNEAIIIFSACFLPTRSRKDYEYVMDHLFMYALTTLDNLVGEDYVLVYLHGGTYAQNMPSFAFIKRCYHMLDHRLRKKLQKLYLVHPTFWVKTILMMIRPFISSKFSKKLRYVESLQELSVLIPNLQQESIPQTVTKFEETSGLMKRA